MKRVLFITNYASPYKVEFYDELSRYLDVTVLFSDKMEEIVFHVSDMILQDAFCHVCKNKQNRFTRIPVYFFCVVQHSLDAGEFKSVKYGCHTNIIQKSTC